MSALPFSAANNSIHADASQIPQSGEELHGTKFINYVPLSPPIMRPRHPPIWRMPPPVDFQQEQPISHIQTSDVARRVDPFANQRVSDPNVPSNAGCSTTTFAQEITPPDGQPMVQLRSLKCEKCRIFMSSPLTGNGRVCSSCLVARRAEKSVVPTEFSSPFSNPDSIKRKDLTGDDNVGPILMTNTVNAVKIKTPSAPPIRMKESPLHQSRPSKRQRLEENSQNSPIETIENADQRATTKIGTARGNASKICSTPSCSRTIPIEAFSNRCMSCVKLDWKFIKDRLDTSRQHHERGARNTLPSALAKSTNAKPRKSVSWSETVTVASGDGTVIQCLDRDVEEAHPSVSDNELDGEDADEVYTSTKFDKNLPTDTPTELESRTQEVLLAPPENPNIQSPWDSDLSELTNESDSSDDDSPPRVSTGLKIKIPARSVIACSRRCKEPWCDQVLASDYPRKTCMICRVLHRQNQRRQKGLNDEDEVTMLDEKPLKLIPNARLCSASECTHFIPPHEDYKFNRCNLCRLYKKERQLRQRGPIHQSKALLDEQKIYNSFRFLPVRFPTSGRCRSVDCGVLHEDRSTSCRQCVARRTRLMRKAGIQEKPLPELNIYPQYRCYVFLLFDFGSRIKAFLKSQTIFFLFKVNQPSLISTKALFSFDGEYSVVALDFDVVGRKTKIDARALKIKKDFEGIDGLKFAAKRLISILEGGGVAIRFLCTYQASILRPVVAENVTTVSEMMKPMIGELEIAVFPDQSHRFLPGEKTVIRFRLLG